MSDHESIPPGHEGIIPHLVVDGAGEAIDFYREAFGAEEVARHYAPDGERLMHGEIRVGGAIVYLVDDFPEYSGGTERNPKATGTSSVTIHRFVEDVDAAVERAREAGAEVTMEPEDMFWGDRYGVVTDPFGHVWSFASHLRDVPEDELQAAAEEAFARS